MGGNLLEKKTYSYVAGNTTLGTLQSTDTYVYGDTSWKDKLTSYNGVAMTYDGIGNPLTWTDPNGAWTATWTMGRQMATLSKTGTSISYKLGADGIRTEKTVNGVTTVYNVVGGVVTWEKTGTNPAIHYTYYANGQLFSLEYNGSSWFYVRNAQNDVIGLVEASTGNWAAQYVYDAWGKPLAILDGSGSDVSGNSAHIANVNPYRYRGYRFDAESGLYYLSSRYYDPGTQRYLNADGVAGADGDLLGSNMFAYCKNNPVMMVDPSGCWPTWGQIFTAVAIVAVAALIVVAVVASAGTVGIALGVAAAGAGATGSMVGAAIAIGTVGAYTVAAGIGACALSNAGEVLTGTNIVRDKVMGGNQGAYDIVQTVFAMAGAGIIAIGQTRPGISGKAATPSKNAKEMHGVPTTGTPRTSVDSLYKGKPGEFQRRFYDHNGNPSLDIDFTGHAPGSGHTNPHFHVWDPITGRQ